MTRDRVFIYCPYVATDANSTICSIQYSVPKQTKTSFLTLKTNNAKIMGLADPEIITVAQPAMAISCHGDSFPTRNDRLQHHCLHSSLQTHPSQRTLYSRAPYHCHQQPHTSISQSPTSAGCATCTAGPAHGQAHTGLLSVPQSREQPAIHINGLALFWHQGLHLAVCHQGKWSWCYILNVQEKLFCFLDIFFCQAESEVTMGLS